MRLQWDYGLAGNLQVAQEIVAAARASGYKFGIYSTPGEWSNMFGSYDVVLDNTLPLWFATFDGIDSLTMTQPFGGSVSCTSSRASSEVFGRWTTAVGKQYSPTAASASKQFDFDVFAAGQ